MSRERLMAPLQAFAPISVTLHYREVKDLTKFEGHLEHTDGRRGGKRKGKHPPSFQGRARSCCHDAYVTLGSGAACARRGVKHEIKADIGPEDRYVVLHDCIRSQLGACLPHAHHRASTTEP